MVLKYYTNIPGAGYDGKFRQNVQMQKEQDSVENQVVNIYPEITYETFEGFGGAITEASGYVYSLMSEEQKQQVIRTYFSPEEMNYSLVRIHLDSCDFCLDTYEAMGDPADTELKSFSFERTEKYIIPMLQDAEKAAGCKLALMLSPWSPPTFMKTNGSRVSGGKLKPEYRKMWAEYICRYIKEFRERGYNVRRLSLQNEPNAVQKWDSCLFTAEEEKEFLKDYMYPALLEHGYDDIEIYIWDHNKERIYERVRKTVDEETKSMIAGAAFHWYSGDHFEAMDLVRAHYPNIKMIMSESCLEYRLFDAGNIDDITIRLSHEIIGDLNHGMCAFYDWNLLLDEKGGPNYAGNYCHSPFLYNTQTKELMPQKTLTDFFQFSHYLKCGYTRIATTKYSDEIDAVAYKTPDNGITLIILNKGKELRPVNFRLNGDVGTVLLPAGTLATCVIE